MAAFLIAFAMCAVDAASKALAVADLTPHRPVRLPGGLITLHLYRKSGRRLRHRPSYTVIYALIEISRRPQDWLGWR